MTQDKDKPRRKDEAEIEVREPAPIDPARARLEHEPSEDLWSRGSDESEETMQAGTAGQPMADDFIARRVVEMGLATDDEVDTCFGLQRAQLDDDRSKLAELLVEHGMITQSQLDRLCDTGGVAAGITGFQIVSKLGEGTSAAVYLAQQIALDRQVAVKILPAPATENPRAIERFYAEGRAAAQLNHPNIVQAIDVGQTPGGHHYFVMEYVPGQTIKTLLRHRGKLGEEDALEIIIAIAEALRHAHERDLVHRDVKPQNIIVSAGGVPKLADLGLARYMTDTETAAREAGRSMGTPFYMSPEQIRGDEHIGPPADIYSLGATFYFMLTGERPFPGETSRQVMKKHLNEPLRPAHEVERSITVGLSEVVSKMLAKDTADRYATCEELLTDLRAWKAYQLVKKTER